MSPGIPLPSSVSAYVGVTQNSEVSVGAAASFDLLWLSDLIISVLENDSLAASTGAGHSASFLYAEDTPVPEKPENLSVKTTNGSAVLARMPCYVHSSDMFGL